MRSLIASLLLLCAVPSLALAKTGVSGPKKNEALHKTLLEVVGTLDDAVDADEGGDKPPAAAAALATWANARVKAEKLDRLIVAQMKGQKVELLVFKGSGKPSKAAYTVGKKGLSKKSRAALELWIGNLIKKGGGDAMPDGDLPEGEGDEPPPVTPAPAAPPPTPPPAAATPPVAPVTSAEAEAPESTPPRPAGSGLLAGALGRPKGAHPLAWVTAGFAGVGRGLSYKDAITSNIRPYQVSVMPTPAGGIELYPLALTDVAEIAGIGLSFEIEHSVGVSSSRTNGPSYPTAYLRLGAGLLYRLSLAEGGLVLIPHARFQVESFELSSASDGTRESELPNVAYTGPAFGLGGELRITDGWYFLFGGDFVLVVSHGELISDAYHKSGSVNGLQGGLGLRVDITGDVAIEGTGMYQHYWYAFSPTPGDPFVAGGALDQFVSFRLAARVAL